MPQPFRFGVQISELPAGGWVEHVRAIEEMGYSTVFVPDHFGPQWDPTAFCAAVGAVTDRLRVGTLVFDVDFRHPVTYAKASATTQLLTGGRHEFGIGAGWMTTDYEQAGIPYDSPGVRVARLDEALTVIRSVWTKESTTFEGEHFTVRDVPQAVNVPDGWEPPQVVVGGGRPKVLALAGRHADVVGINPSLHEGRVTMKTALDLVPERVGEKVAWAKEAAAAAGRDPDALEFQSLVFVLALMDDATPAREGIAASTGMTVDQVADSPLFITGSAAEIQDTLSRRREQSGLNYIVIRGDLPDLERYAEAFVRPLTGS